NWLLSCRASFLYQCESFYAVVELGVEFARIALSLATRHLDAELRIQRASVQQAGNQIRHVVVVSDVFPQDGWRIDSGSTPACQGRDEAVGWADGQRIA